MKNKHLYQGLDSNKNELVKTDVFGIGITNEKKDSILEFVLESLEKKAQKYFIVTPNPEMVVHAVKHPAFKKILNKAEIALCDGMQLFRAARFVGKPLQERITGVEFMETLCKYISEKPITVGFLGGRGGVAKIAAERLVRKFPGLRVEFVGEEEDELSNYELHTPRVLSSQKWRITDYNKEKDNKKNYKDSRLEKKNPKHLDILFVAFGFPKQEEWMFTNLSKFNVTVMMGVGGAFDYISGRIPRAPQWMQSVGFEWIYRLVRQPWRWRRQLSLIEFIWLVMKEKFKKGK